MLYGPEVIEAFSGQTFAFIVPTFDAHVLTITLNRADKKNAMSPTVMREIAYCLAFAHHNPAVWAVVLRANGDIFCAGADLKAFAGIPEEPNASSIPDTGQEVLLGELFNGLHKPCIARVHAPLFAGAFLLICGCTHVVATPNVSLALPEVKRGIWPMQVMASLRSILNKRQILDLCMRGHTFSAEEALDMGIITHLVADETEMDSRIGRLLTDIKTNSPAAIRLGLKAWDDLRSVAEAEEHAFLKARLNEILQTADAQEGLAAFREKRAPNWTGQ
ncbi:MAG: enoyl-CoA hydratase/isomerase family protein [Bacteroidetes bacterium]|nr:enoyl-CoA hydratase/isomerase family protein [Bacteroidota bacterium]